jgi:hypothetical protein
VFCPTSASTSAGNSANSVLLMIPARFSQELKVVAIGCGYLLRVALPCVDLVQEAFFVNGLPFRADPCLFELNGCATDRA